MFVIVDKQTKTLNATQIDLYDSMHLSLIYTYGYLSSQPHIRYDAKSCITWKD